MIANESQIYIKPDTREERQTYWAMMSPETLSTITGLLKYSMLGLE